MNKKNDLRKERKLKRIEANKLAILKAAEDVFVNKGYSLATVDDIAEEAQFSKATLYRYFKSKDEIFYTIALNSFKYTQARMEDILTQNINSEQKLKNVIQFNFSFFHEKKNLVRVFFMEKSFLRKIFQIDSLKQTGVPFPHPKLPSEFTAISRDILHIMKKILEEGIQRKEFRPVNVENAVYVLTAMMRGFFFHGPIQVKEFNTEQSTELLHDIFLNGIKINKEIDKE